MKVHELAKLMGYKTADFIESKVIFLYRTALTKIIEKLIEKAEIYSNLTPYP